MSWLLTCKQASRLQSEALDRKLGFSQRLGLCLHLLICRLCRRYGRQIAFLRVIGKHCAEDSDLIPSPPLPPEARERIQRRIEQEAK